MLGFFKKSTTTKPVSILLTVVMVFSLFVVNGRFAFADTLAREVTVHNEDPNGTITFEGFDETVTQNSFENGSTVTLVSDPKDGYMLSTLRITNKSNKKAVSYNVSGDRITFKMPRAEVDVYPTFEVATLSVDTDHEVTGTDMYIKSNLNPEYVSYSKWEVVNAITVKQTIADASVFEAAGRNVTIDDMYPVSNEDWGDYLIEALLNFQVSASEIIDVDPSSEYYIAFVNTMQDDDNAELRDYAFAKNNVFGEVLDKCIMDESTGIAYIPKSYFTEDEIGNIQVQLLNTYNNAKDSEEHKIELIVNDPGNISILKSGVVTTGIYDNNIKFKLANDTDSLYELSLASISVSINGVKLDNDGFNYDETTGVLSLIGQPINIDTITVDIEKASVVAKVMSNLADDFIAEAYSSWSAFCMTKPDKQSSFNQAVKKEMRINKNLPGFCPGRFFRKEWFEINQT